MVVLPFGQFDKKPWMASCYYAQNGEQGPGDDWFSKDFDDSEWGTIEGPISTRNGISYYATPWGNNYSTYWVRRHFQAKDLEDYPFWYLYLYHDDGCQVYLNGTEIYSSSSYYTNQVTVEITKDIASLVTEGDNVVAVRVSDTGGGEAFMDFGIEAYSVALLTNSNFDNGTTGWVTSGDGFSHGGQSFNYLYRNLGSNPFDVHQMKTTSKTGLYRLRVQAFEAFNNWNDGWKNYQKSPVESTIYIDNNHHSINNVFDEAVSPNIYRSNEFFKTPVGTYVPTYMTSVSIAFSNGMYENEFYAFVDTTTFNVGICQPNHSENEKWVCFDNFRLEYIGENVLRQMVDEINSLTSKPMEFTYKKGLAELSDKLNASDTYDAIGRMIADYTDILTNARHSSVIYSLLQGTAEELQCRLDTGNYMSDATIAEAVLMLERVEDIVKSGSATSKEVLDLISELNSLKTRLNYVYIDVAVLESGTLGDLILSKVENFVDVQSLKVSGNLNDADLNTIQSRLSQLREIDMSGVNMLAFPNRFFYQRQLLEIVKLPSKLQSIGEYAFYQCYGIKNIDFPSTLTSIGYSAFSECDNLHQVILPEGFVNLGSYAFHSCDNNVYVKLPSTLKTIGEYAFRYNLSLKNIDFSEGLTHIYRCAFMECYDLNDVVLPKSLYFIGDNAFAYNRSLSNIAFNEGLYQIADNAFYDCDALTEVTLPSSLVLANASPFDYCDNLKKVTCLSIEPPYMTDQIPYGLGMEGRELYVPALSINVYKQTTGWDKFQTIKPLDYLPENFTVLGDIRLTLPETMPTDYKPNVSIIHDQKGSSYWQYGSLTVNGVGTLSMNNFDMIWDPNYQYIYPDRSQNYTSLVNNTHLRSDNVSISMWTRNDRWSFVSFPFNVKVSDIETIADGTTNWVVRKYDGQKRASGETSETWSRLTSDDVLNAGEGYIIQGSRYIGNNWQEHSGFRMHAINDSKKNNIFNSADATVTMNEYESEFAHNRSWNLIGNPYPCYYDTRFMDFNAPITVWNMRDNTYTAYSPSDDSYILCPGEAFFVQRPIDNGTINFAKEGRQTNRSVRTINAPARAKAFAQYSTNRIIANVTISDGENTDRTRVVLNDNATMDYEMDKDATKFMSSDPSVPQIFTSKNGINYAINERPISDGVVSLNLHIGKDGFYSISLPETVDGYNVILEDKIEGKMITLTADTEYTFSAKSGDCTGRFLLHFSDETTGIDEINSTIKDNSSFYSIQGIKVTTSSQKGVYIQNGKKIMINK